MAKLKIKIKFEDKIFSDTIHCDDDYIFSKQNPAFLALIASKCKESGFEQPDSVIANIFMDL